MTSTQSTLPPARTPLAVTPAGIVATLVLAAVVVACIRLGFWQLDRLAQRRQFNARIATRLHTAPITDIDHLRDTTGLHYRTATVPGSYDNDRWIVLPGRSYRGMPGVHLLTPLRLADRADAVLVNRGWVPSADAASIDVSRLSLGNEGPARGLVLPFPTSAESLAARDPAATDGVFRRVWFAIDEPALRAQFPYPLLPVMLQELPDSVGRAGAPTRLDPPPLDAGPHLGYALQWFSFAFIGIVGWLALVLRSRTPRRSAPAAAAVLLSVVGALPANGQLRPLDPIEWSIFDRDVYLVGDAGVGVLWDQPATLAGVRGRLLEVGNYGITVRSGRMAIEVSGTVVWRLNETRQTDPPAAGVQPARDGTRQDVGVATAATAFNISLVQWRTDVVLRFGATIPTTSDESGLDRDRTDFFATLALRYPRGPLTLWMENGLGINGTTSAEYPQSDVWTFAYGAMYRVGPVRPTVMLIGRQDGHSWIVRGNEDQRELRIGGDIGESRWLALHYIRGLADHSPAHGVRIGVGMRLRQPSR